jgi:hypothetical protein
LKISLFKYPSGARKGAEGGDEPSPGAARRVPKVSLFKRLNSALHPTRFFGQTQRLQGDSCPVVPQPSGEKETQKQQTPHEAGLHNRLSREIVVVSTAPLFPNSSRQSSENKYFR